MASANGHPDFPIQNLPLGVFTPPGGGPPRGGVAIGDKILDLRPRQASRAARRRGRRAPSRPPPDGALNALFGARRRPAPGAAGAALRAAGRRARPSARRLEPLLHRAADCTLHLPAQIGDYTDFYAGIHHATNVGKLFRPDNPLLPNYKYVPIGYHGRASSIVPVRHAGAPPERPAQAAASEAAPSFGPCRNARLRARARRSGSAPATRSASRSRSARRREHVAGFCLLNDWSARDIQAWEYQPLGPFLAKNFATTVSPWVVTPEALAPFRAPQPPRPEGDPAPLPYLLRRGRPARRAPSTSSSRCCC